MAIQLGNGVRIKKAERVINNYYRSMGRGVHEYDKAKLPEDNSFPEEQIRKAIKLANKLGARIPYKVTKSLAQREQEIQLHLQRIPTNMSILDNEEKIPWDELKALFDTLRIKYVSIPRLTKILHKKWPHLVPILDSVMVGEYLEPVLAKQGIANIQGETEKAVCHIKELKKDVDTNRQALIQLQNYCRNKYYDISVTRVLDILLWSCLGPFKDKLCKDC